MPVAGRCYSPYKRATRQKDAAHAGMGREGGAETRGVLGVPRGSRGSCVEEHYITWGTGG